MLGKESFTPDQVHPTDGGCDLVEILSEEVVNGVICRPIHH